jgi:hypothetical protein
LGDFILAIQRRDKFILDYVDHDNFKVDFPHFMISIIRKIKMASKKHTSKPFNYNQKFTPGQYPGQPNTFVMPYFYPNQMNMVNLPPKAPLLPETNFASVSDLQLNKEKFMALPEEERLKITRIHLMAKLPKFKSIINMLVKKVRQRHG